MRVFIRSTQIWIDNSNDFWMNKANIKPKGKNEKKIETRFDQKNNCNIKISLLTDSEKEKKKQKPKLVFSSHFLIFVLKTSFYSDERNKCCNLKLQNHFIE